MTLLIAVFAAIISTVLWYRDVNGRMRLGTLCLIYWGASIMWLVDAVTEYIEVGAAYFRPAPADMLNDSYLGMSVVALGLLIWLAALLVRDPEGRVRKALNNKQNG